MVRTGDISGQHNSILGHASFPLYPIDRYCVLVMVLSSPSRLLHRDLTIVELTLLDGTVGTNP